MAKNLIPQIVQMLGLQLGEEFKIKEYGERIYRFANSGLIYDNGVRNLSITTNMALSGLLSGDLEIVKFPWKPKEGESFYTFTAAYGEWSVSLDVWAEEPCNYALLDKGWIYRTEKEAKAALPAVLKELSERRKS